MSSQSGESVLVYGEETFFHVSYFRRHGLENGALLASARFCGTRSAQCEPALPGRLWCLENCREPLFAGRGLRVRDAESLGIVADQDQMLRGIPELAGTQIDRIRLHRKTRGFVFNSRDGHQWVIDPTTLTPARFDGVGLEPDRQPDPSIDTGYRYEFTEEFTEGTRRYLERYGPGDHGGVWLHPEHTYLNGRVVTQLDNPPRVLVLEDVIGHGATLWCLFANGRAQWKVKDFCGNRDGAGLIKLYRDRMLLVTSSRLIAIRTQDGAVVWSTPP